MMRPLDYIIEDFEDAHVQIIGYYDEYHNNNELKSEVLQYLQEYNKILKAWNIIHNMREGNEPLTREELESMRGKPVWIKDNLYNLNQWYIISYCTDDTWKMITHDDCGRSKTFDFIEMGKTWQAYKEERL